MVLNVICTLPDMISGEALRHAFVGHVHDLDARLGPEELGDEVQARADAGRAEVDLAGWTRALKRAARPPS